MVFQSRFCKQYNEFYNLLKPFSKESNEWKTLSLQDRADIEKWVMVFLSVNPDFATYAPRNFKPFILFCAECGLEKTVMWFLDKIKNTNIKDKNGDNIALYAYKYKLNKVLERVKEDYELANHKNNDGISLAYYLKKDEARKNMQSGNSTNTKTGSCSTQQNDSVEYEIIDEFFR